MSQQREIGTLVVVVLKAQHLHQPSFYKQDPYAQVSLSGLKKRTKIAPKGGQHPVWDEELRFPVLGDAGKSNANRILEVACYKDEQRGEDVLLGKGTVDIEETLKTGEFDDWVSLETSTGTRGEVYLEMTFYANSPPPVTRRPSKLNPSDRLARPAQGGRSLETSPQRGDSPEAAERKPGRPPPTSGGQIPASLIPSHVPKGQGSRQAPPNGVPSSVSSVKHRDSSLPPLPAVNDISEASSGKMLPVALHPGGRSGSRPAPPQNWSQVISKSPSPSEILSEQLNRSTFSDTPAPRAATNVPQVQIPVQSHPPETTSMTGAGLGFTPSIVVEEHPLEFPVPLPSSPGPTPSYVQQAFSPAPTPSFSRSLSPFEPQPREYYGVPPYGTPTSPRHQQHLQYPNGTMVSHPPSSPQSYPPPQSSQLRQQQPQYSSQQLSYPPQVLQHPPYQHPYLPFQPQQQQQHRPQHLPYSQSPRPSQAQQPHHQQDLQVLPATPQQPLYSEAKAEQSYLSPSPSSLVQSPTLQTHTQPHFSLPSPPHEQDRRKPSIPYSVAQPSQTQIPPPGASQGPVAPPAPSQQTDTPVTHLPQPPALLPSQAITETGTILREAGEVLEDVDISRTAEEKAVIEERGVTDERNTGHRVEEERHAEEERSVHDEINSGYQVEVDKRPEGEPQKLEDSKGQEKGYPQEVEPKSGQEGECKKQTEERSREDELWEQEELSKREEDRRREEEEHQRREEEERRRRVEELRKEEEEYIRRVEELKREEERRRREDERRKEEEKYIRRMEELKREEERRRREDERRKEEEEYIRRVEELKREEERRRREDERRRQKEEQILREREEAERRREEAETRRRHAEEARAERRWQEELARIRERAEQEAADAAFARAQMEAEEAERRGQEEANLALVRQAREEAEREERLDQERRRQIQADMEVARREQAHEEELERRRQEERRKKVEEADRELARRLDMELNLSTEFSSGRGDRSQQRRTAGTGGH